jgi:hypothetical protein
VNTEPSEHSLKVHEWLVIILFIAGLSLLGATAHFFHSSHNQHPTDLPHYISDPTIEVFVKGDVEHPGTYRMKAGACVSEVLFLARPKASADLRRIRLESKLRNGRVLNIPAKKEKKKRQPKTTMKKISVLE